MMTAPAGVNVCRVHALRSRSGVADGVNKVCSGLVIVFVPLEPELEVAPWYSRIANKDAGLRLEVMIVETPAAVAISAAMSFVSIPPVPRFEPRVAVLTVAIT